MCPHVFYCHEKYDRGDQVDDELEEDHVFHPGGGC